MKHIITLLLLAATVASGEKPVEVYRSGYSWVFLIVVEGHKYLLFDGLDKGGITHAASCTNHAPVVVTNYEVRVVNCQRTHCDTSRAVYYGTATFYRVLVGEDSMNYLNQPNTWPGTYSTNYVTNAANVEKED